MHDIMTTSDLITYKIHLLPRHLKLKIVIVFEHTISRNNPIYSLYKKMRVIELGITFLNRIIEIYKSISLPLNW